MKPSNSMCALLAVPARIALIASVHLLVMLTVVGCMSHSTSSTANPSTAQPSVLQAAPAQSAVNEDQNGNGSDQYAPGGSIDRQDAIDEHWDDIKDDLNGSTTVEACSSESGNCYDLDADIESGAITEIRFNNGGYLYFNADIDSDGNASDSDENGNDWDFTVDMNSSVVDDAIDEWASENGYSIER